MENTNITNKDGQIVSVNGIFYVFNSKYYFIYTTGELEENGYVKLYLVQVGKEVVNTPTGPTETGNMVGVEITNTEEWKSVQSSITQIVEDKKNGTQSDSIKYLPINTLNNLKIISENKFKLLKEVVEEKFNINVSTPISQSEIQPLPAPTPLDQVIQPTINQPTENSSEDVIIDYRTKFFEEQDKNTELEEKIKNLEEKIENIKKIIE